MSSKKCLSMPTNRFLKLFLLAAILLYRHHLKVVFLNSLLDTKLHYSLLKLKNTLPLIQHF